MEEILSLKIPDAKNFIKHVAMRHRDPLFFWGEPGVGKSALVKQVCEEVNGYLVDIRLAQYDSVDLRGFPGAVQGRTVWNVPSTIPFTGNADRFPGDRPIFLFLDEANSGNQAVFAVAMQLVHERRIGEHELMSNVIVLAAGNRESDRGVANRMPTSLSNRFVHAEIVVDVDAYCAYRQTKGALPVELAFYNFRKNMLSTFDPSKPDKAFATPRSCEKAWTYYADPEMPATLKRTAMAGAMGLGPTTEALGFVEIWHKVIPIPMILADPQKAPLPEAGDASMNYATAVSVSHAMICSNADALDTYLERMAPEFCILAWRLAIQRDKNVAQADSFVKMGKKHKAIFA